MRRVSRHISSKMTKTNVMLAAKGLRERIPETRRLTRESLRSMLDRYGMVYVKPFYGSQGRGVMRVERRSAGRAKGGGAYRYQTGLHVRSFRTFDPAYRSLQSAAGRESYLVQQGIRLLAFRGSPFDIRVMVQRNPNKRWEVTGLAGRVAHPGKIVTNGSQGGTIYPVQALLEPHADRRRRQRLISAMKQISREAAVRMGAAYPEVREVGADIAVDRRMRLWILEVNTLPDPCPFTKLKDKSMLRRIIQCGKSYGRTYRLKCTKSKAGTV